MLPAAMVPQPSSTPPGGPAPSNPVVAATTVTPARSRARGGPPPRKPAVRAAKIAPQPPTVPGGPRAGNTVVTPPSMAPGIPAPGNPVMPAARVTPPPPTEPATPAKPVSPRKSTKKIPAGRSHWESAPIEEMVAYACSLPVTPELIRNLKMPGMTEDLLLLALERLCQRIERDWRQPYPDRWSLSGARSVVPSPSAPTQATPKSIESGAIMVSCTKGSDTTPALKSTTAVQAPSLVLLMNSST